MPGTLIPAFVLPLGLIIFGVVMLRQPADPRMSWDWRPLGGRLALAGGVGGLVIAAVRLVTGS